MKTPKAKAKASIKSLIELFASDAAPVQAATSEGVAGLPGDSGRTATFGPILPRRTAELRVHTDVETFIPRLGTADQKALRDRLTNSGLPAPLEVTPAGEVIVGHEELLAAQYLGWAIVQVVVRDDLAADAHATFMHIVAANCPRLMVRKIDQVKWAWRLWDLESRKSAANKAKVNCGGNVSACEDEAGETRKRLCRLVGLEVGYYRTLDKGLTVLDYAADHPKSVGTLFEQDLLPAQTALDGIALPHDTQHIIYNGVMETSDLAHHERAKLAKQLVRERCAVGQPSSPKAAAATTEKRLSTLHGKLQATRSAVTDDQLRSVAQLSTGFLDPLSRSRCRTARRRPRSERTLFAGRSTTGQPGLDRTVQPIGDDPSRGEDPSARLRQERPPSCVTLAGASNPQLHDEGPGKLQGVSPWCLSPGGVVNS